MPSLSPINLKYCLYSPLPPLVLHYTLFSCPFLVSLHQHCRDTLSLFPIPTLLTSWKCVASGICLFYINLPPLVHYAFQRYKLIVGVEIWSCWFYHHTSRLDPWYSWLICADESVFQSEVHMLCCGLQCSALAVPGLFWTSVASAVAQSSSQFLSRLWDRMENFVLQRGKEGFCYEFIPAFVFQVYDDVTVNKTNSGYPDPTWCHS